MNRCWSTVVAAACATLMGSSLAHAQDSLQQVKALYASAAYEDALSMVGRLQTSERKLEFQQYRVYCLVALGRTAEAEDVIATVVVENPTFVPDAGETSPRIQGMFQRIRSGLVPELAQRMYLEARAAWNRKDTAAAAAQFASLVQLIDSTRSSDGEGESNPEKAEPMLAELRLLASGFLDLSHALSAPPAGADTGAPALAAKAPVAVTSPVPLKQDLPVWVPTDQASRREFRGVLRVFISDAGLVTGAELSSPIHPAYDRQLLLAAKTWTYQPALKDGVPMSSEKLIEVVLKPR